MLAGHPDAVGKFGLAWDGKWYHTIESIVLEDIMYVCM